MSQSQNTNGDLKSVTVTEKDFSRMYEFALKQFGKENIHYTWAAYTVHYRESHEFIFKNEEDSLIFRLVL